MCHSRGSKRLGKAKPVVSIASQSIRAITAQRAAAKKKGRNPRESRTGRPPRPRLSSAVNPPPQGAPGVAHRRQLRPADGKEVEHDPEHETAVVEPERPAARPFAECVPLTRRVAQTEIDESDPEQAEGAEERGMGVVERKEGAVLVVIDERRVQGPAAKHTRTDEIPERRAEDVEVGEPVLELTGGGDDEAVLLYGLDDEEE